jgi:hypothetical protein
VENTAMEGWKESIGEATYQFLPRRISVVIGVPRRVLDLKYLLPFRALVRMRSDRLSCSLSFCFTFLPSLSITEDSRSCFDNEWRVEAPETSRWGIGSESEGSEGTEATRRWEARCSPRTSRVQTLHLCVPFHLNSETPLLQFRATRVVSC